MADKIIYRKSNKPANLYGFAGFLNKSSDWLSGSSGASGAGANNKVNSLGLTQGGTQLASAGLGMISGLAGGLLNPNGVSTGAGNALQGIGSIASAIPGVGGLVGSGLSAVGGLVNSAFGSKLNDAFIDSTNSSIKKQAAYNSEASDSASLMSDYNAYTDLGNVSKSQVGSDGWFSNKASKKAKELNNKINDANIRARSSLVNAGNNISEQNMLNALANYSAFGGPLNFTRDSASYPHLYQYFDNRPFYKDGGILEGDFDLGDKNITDEELKALKKLGYEVTID